MADADTLIFTALQQSECLDTADDGKLSSSSSSSTDWSVKDLSCDALVVIVWKCLARLRDAAGGSQLDFQLPASFAAPVGVAARHRVGSQLANILKREGDAQHPVVAGREVAASGCRKQQQQQCVVIIVIAIGILSTDFVAIVIAEQRELAESFFLLEAGENATLALKTSSVELPWQPQADAAGNASGFLFERFPQEALRPASLLAALASNRRRSMQKIGVFDEEDDLGFEEAHGGEVAQQARSGAIRNGAADEKSVGGSSTNLGFMSQSGFADDDDEDDEDEFAVPTLKGEGSFGEYSALRSVESLVSGGAGTGGDASNADVQTSQGPPVLSQATTYDTELLVPEFGDGVKNATLTGKEVSAISPAEEQELLERMHTQLVDTQQRIVKMRKVIERDEKELHKIQSQIDGTKARGNELKKQLATRKKMLEMLPQAKENIAKLENICTTNAEKLQQLEAEWETHRAPLVKEEARLVAMKSNRKLRCRQFVAEMKTFRQEMKEMASMIQEKMDAMRVLDNSYAQLPQNLNRNMYTTRIMEIIKQVHKQKTEITKIIDDIKSIQKQLNFASEKLKRSEAVAEDKLYSAASSAVASSSSSSSSSKDGQNPFVECYRKFAEVRELFEELILVVGDVGKKENAARDLENWISQLQTRDSSRHLDKVLTDLQSVQQENSALLEQLRARNA